MDLYMDIIMGAHTDICNNLEKVFFMVPQMLRGNHTDQYQKREQMTMIFKMHIPLTEQNRFTFRT